MNNMVEKDKKAFTLAEVLITLSILGVIATITIPTMMRRISDRKTVTAVKMAYSTVDSALRMMYAIEGNPYNYDWPNKRMEAFRDDDNNNFFGEKLKNYLAVQKYCGSDAGCFPTKSKLINTSKKPCYRPLNNDNTGDNPCYNNLMDQYRGGKMVLKNGMLLSVEVPFPINNQPSHYGKDMYIGYIVVDINGEKGPNMNGIDLFYFLFNKNGLYLDYTGRFAPWATSADFCNKDNGSSHDNGKSCALWILRHNNMDYKYRDVSAEW